MVEGGIMKRMSEIAISSGGLEFYALLRGVRSVPGV